MKLNDKVSWLADCVKKVYSSGLVLLLKFDQNIQIDATLILRGVSLYLQQGRQKRCHNIATVCYSLRWAWLKKELG